MSTREKATLCTHLQSDLKLTTEIAPTLFPAPAFAPVHCPDPPSGLRPDPVSPASPPPQSET